MKGVLNMQSKDKIQEVLTRSVSQVMVRKSLTEKLRSGKRLRVKLGVDPTASNLHLGHSVVLRKLRQFQDLGHTAIFLVGDFTARIGDPSDKLSARKPLSEQEIADNMRMFKKQAGKVLDLDKTEVRYNSEWHKNMDFAELFEVMSRFTVNQMIERDMFKERLKKGKPLWVHELMYPILQGYDSVALQADVELGGTDQTFNMLAARTIQPYYRQPPQDILTVNLIEGTDGKDKMSMSLGNGINITDTPKEMFGKVMSIPDKLIIKYFTLLTDVPVYEIKNLEQGLKDGTNPRNVKFRLAEELVTMYHGKVNAIAAGKEFNKVFKDKKAPDKMPQLIIGADSMQLTEIIVKADLTGSKSEARRLVEQGGVYLDNKQIKDWNKKVTIKSDSVLKVGKRKFVKLVK
ncbi:tyrosine--tRNA ligase [Patescibacteria group bacterium]|nr:tyrosine--tRNA ligase [Patescibacteria group bacterium]